MDLKFFLTISILMALAVFAIIYGFLLIFFPDSIRIFGVRENKVIAITDTKIFPHRYLWGLIFFAAGIFLLYSAFVN
ncbi:MAG: hypothetical protein V3S48_07060 [Candidatus Neomarinimicrobiota bacterium]